jgi:TPR repeat protein
MPALKRCDFSYFVFVVFVTLVSSLCSWSQNNAATPKRSARPTTSKTAQTKGSEAHKKVSTNELVLEADQLSRDDVHITSLKRAAALYRQAAELGDARAQMRYAEFLISYSSKNGPECVLGDPEPCQGPYEPEKYYTQARALLEKSASQRYEPGKVRLTEEMLAGEYRQNQLLQH